MPSKPLFAWHTPGPLPILPPVSTPASHSTHSANWPLSADCILWLNYIQLQRAPPGRGPSLMTPSGIPSDLHCLWSGFVGHASPQCVTFVSLSLWSMRTRTFYLMKSDSPYFKSSHLIPNAHILYFKNSHSIFLGIECEPWGVYFLYSCYAKNSDWPTHPFLQLPLNHMTILLGRLNWEMVPESYPKQASEFHGWGRI